jgi:hypothetical protein
MPRILPSITTHGTGPSSWRDKLCEVQELRLPEVALFLTGIAASERPEFFEALKAASRKHSFTIPFVHAVATMRDEEFCYLRDEYGTEAFNLHPIVEFPLHHELSADTRSRIFIENTAIEFPLEYSDVEDFAGLCLDLSHLEDARRSAPESFEQICNLTKYFPVGANHISAVSALPVNRSGDLNIYSKHVIADLSEIKYLQGTPKAAIAQLCAIELENTIREQLEVRERIESALRSTEQAPERSVSY